MMTTVEFARLPGKVMAPVPITAEMSEYVRIVKSDLLKKLDFYGITMVDVIEEGDGVVLFLGGVES